jgi:phosphate-selective porin OprO/OprP
MAIVLVASPLRSDDHDDPAPRAAAGAESSPEIDPAMVRRIVAEYLKEQDEKKREAEQEQKEKEAAAGVEVGADTKTQSAWRDGLHWQTGDGAYRFTVGGRVDFDTTFYAAPQSVVNSLGQFNNFTNPDSALSDGSDFRRARLRFQGTIYEVVEFISEYDFSNYLDLRRRTLGINTPANQPTAGDFDPVTGTRYTDVWLGINHLPWIGTFRAGHQKEWISFTNATSGRFLTFIERPAIFDAFNVDFQFSNGFTIQRNFWDERAYVWLGLFRNNSNFGAFEIGDGNFAYDARITCLPIWRDDGYTWVHLGADVSYRTLLRDQTRFRARPMVFAGQSFQTPNVVNSGTIFSRGGETIGTLEYASVFGRLTVASEYAFGWVPNAYTGGLPAPDGTLPAGVVARGDYFSHGWYVEALYFLTDDHRPYRREQPGYDRIRPTTNFFFVRGPGCGPIWGSGAWEVGLRYDYLDLSDKGVNGGIYHAITSGVNWHLNANAKIQFNLSWMRRDFTPTDFAGRQPGDFWGFCTRFHWDF